MPSDGAITLRSLCTNVVGLHILTQKGREMSTIVLIISNRSLDCHQLYSILQFYIYKREINAFWVFRKTNEVCSNFCFQIYHLIYWVLSDVLVSYKLNFFVLPKQRQDTQCPCFLCFRSTVPVQRQESFLVSLRSSLMPSSGYSWFLSSMLNVHLKLKKNTCKTTMKEFSLRGIRAVRKNQDSCFYSFVFFSFFYAFLFWWMGKSLF